MSVDVSAAGDNTEKTIYSVKDVSIYRPPLGRSGMQATPKVTVLTVSGDTITVTNGVAVTTDGEGTVKHTLTAVQASDRRRRRRMLKDDEPLVPSEDTGTNVRAQAINIFQ